MHRLAATSTALVLAAALLPAQGPHDPAAWWRLDETSGAVAADSGPLGNNGLLTGYTTPSWTQGQFGNGLQLNGTTNYIFAPTGTGLPIYNNKRYSIAFWVNAGSQGDRRVYSEGDFSNLNPLFTIGTGGNSTTASSSVRLFIRADNGGTRLNVESVAPAFDNTWHHVAWVDNAGTGRLYIDGALDSTWIYDQPVMTLSRVAAGAVLRNTASHFLAGVIDELRIYPYCLTPADVEMVRLSTNPISNSFQLNQSAADLSINDVPGSPGNYAEATVGFAEPVTLAISSNRAGYPWELAAVSTPPVAGLLPMTQNILNVDIFHPSAFFLNGGFQSSWGNVVSIPGLPPASSTASLVQVVTSPSFPASISVQFAIADPASPDGFHLSAPARLVVN